MGIYTHCVVDRETDSLEEARRLGEQVVAWLVERQIIENRLIACPLGDQGYSPGPHYWRAWGAPERSLPGPGDDGFLTSGRNGVQLHMQRNLYLISQGDFGPARCPHCEGENEPASYYEACDEWMKGGIGNLRCEECGVVAPVSRWGHDSVLCGTLGLVFWDWPSLSPEFLHELSERTGRRVSLIEGKQ